MVKDKPLTKKELIKALKEIGVATKSDISGLRFDMTKLERRLILRMGKMENSLRQAIADLAETTPTRKEFEELKQRVSGRYGFV